MKFEINRRGTLYTIEQAVFTGHDPNKWKGTRNGGAETLIAGRNPYDVLKQLVEAGIAAEFGLPAKLHDWNEVREY